MKRKVLISLLSAALLFVWFVWLQLQNTVVQAAEYPREGFSCDQQTTYSEAFCWFLVELYDNLWGPNWTNKDNWFNTWWLAWSWVHTNSVSGKHTLQFCNNNLLGSLDWTPSAAALSELFWFELNCWSTKSKITSISKGFFSTSGYIDTVYLWGVWLQTIEPWTFDGVSIRDLDLSDNSELVFYPEMFRWLKVFKLMLANDFVGNHRYVPVDVEWIFLGIDFLWNLGLNYVAPILKSDLLDWSFTWDKSVLQDPIVASWINQRNKEYPNYPFLTYLYLKPIPSGLTNSFEVWSFAWLANLESFSFYSTDVTSLSISPNEFQYLPSLQKTNLLAGSFPFATRSKDFIPYLSWLIELWDTQYGECRLRLPNLTMWLFDGMRNLEALKLCVGRDSWPWYDWWRGWSLWWTTSWGKIYDWALMWVNTNIELSLRWHVEWIDPIVWDQLRSFPNKSIDLYYVDENKDYVNIPFWWQAYDKTTPKDYKIIPYPHWPTSWLLADMYPNILKKEALRRKNQTGSVSIIAKKSLTKVYSWAFQWLDFMYDRGIDLGWRVQCIDNGVWDELRKFKSVNMRWEYCYNADSFGNCLTWKTVTFWQNIGACWPLPAGANGYAGNTTPPPPTQTWTVQPVAQPTITYYPRWPVQTSENVYAVMEFPWAWYKVVNNGWSNVYTFLQNGTFMFEYEDPQGVRRALPASVNWIYKPWVTTATGNNTVQITYTPTWPTITNQDVVATIVFPSNSYKVINNNWSNRHTFTGNGIYTFQYIDSLWKYNTLTATVSWISKTQPQQTQTTWTMILQDPRIMYSPKWPGKTSKDVIAVVIFPSEWYRIVNNGWSRAYTFKENGFYIFQYEDISGRYGSVTAYVDWIDRNVQAPETSFPVENTSSLGQSLWTTQPIEEKKLTDAELFSWASSIWITTQSTLKQAMFDRNVTREEFAKMLSTFAKTMNRWWNEQNALCSRYSDLSKAWWDLRTHITQVCNIWLMWRTSDWWVMKSFYPKNNLTQWDVVTTLSRMLWWRFYNQDWTDFWKKHIDIFLLRWFIDKAEPMKIQTRREVFTLFKQIDDFLK